MEQSLQELMLSALIKGGVNEITKAAYEYLQCPVMITDADYNCVAHFPDTLINDPLWDVIHENGCVPLQFIRMFNDENMIQNGTQQKAPYFVNNGFLMEHPRIISNIIVKDSIVAYIAILKNCLGEEDYNTVKTINDVFTIEFQRTRTRIGNMTDSWSLFLSSLIHGKINNQEDLEQWQKILKREIKGDFCMVAAQPAKGTEEDLLLPFIQRNIMRIDPELYPVIYGNSLYFFLMGITSRELYHRKINAFAAKLASLGLVYGISNMFFNVTQVEIFRDQALFASTVCLDKAPDEPYIYYEDCAMKQIMEVSVKNLPVENCIHPAICVLKAYDKKNKTEYYKTLSAYICSMCNTVETVQNLHIHRNTLPYRIHVIEQITGIDFSNHETCAYLLYSFHIIAYNGQ